MTRYSTNRIAKASRKLQESAAAGKFSLNCSLSGVTVPNFPISEKSGMTLTYGEGSSREGIQNLCLQPTEAKLCSSYVAATDQLDVESQLALSGQQLVHCTEVIRWAWGNAERMVREKVRRARPYAFMAQSLCSPSSSWGDKSKSLVLCKHLGLLAQFVRVTHLKWKHRTLYPPAVQH